MSSRSSPERPRHAAVPQISVLTVVRNGEATLRRAIESVVAQLSDNAEYIIVDGASTDGTVDIIKDYENRLAHWQSEPDGGIYDAMNKALLLARGDWVIFLGADDELKPNLQTVARKLIDPQAVYYGDVEIASTGAISGRKFSRYRLMQENICHQAVFYPRTVYCSKRYDTKIGLLADHQYNIELWGGGTRFVHVDEVVSRFNDRGRSSSGDPRFEATKLALIRRNFGLPLYVIKRVRTTCVRLLKARHVAP